jgi:hypothetical protein
MDGGGRSGDARNNQSEERMRGVRAEKFSDLVETLLVLIPKNYVLCGESE